MQLKQVIKKVEINLLFLKYMYTFVCLVSGLLAYCKKCVQIILIVHVDGAQADSMTNKPICN